MPRGRPRLAPKKEITNLELRIAEYICKYLCAVPGCMAAIHIEDARSILDLMKEET